MYGAIQGCQTSDCARANTLTAFLDVLYCLITYLLMHAFVAYAKKLETLDDERTVRVEEEHHLSQASACKRKTCHSNGPGNP